MSRRPVSSSREEEIQKYEFMDLNQLDVNSPLYIPKTRNLGRALFGHPPQELAYSDDERSSSSSYLNQYSGQTTIQDLLRATMEDSSEIDNVSNEQDQISLLLELVANDIDDTLEEVVDDHNSSFDSQPELKDDPYYPTDEEVVEDSIPSIQDEIVEEEEEPVVSQTIPSPIRTPVKKVLPSPKPKPPVISEGSKKRRVAVSKKNIDSLKKSNQ